MNMTEEKISGLKDRSIEIIQFWEQRQIFKNVRTSDPWDNIKWSNVHVIGVSEREDDTDVKKNKIRK